MEDQKEIALLKDNILKFLQQDDSFVSWDIYKKFGLEPKSGSKLLREIESRGHIKLGERISSEGACVVSLKIEGEKFLKGGGHELEYAKYCVFKFFKEHGIDHHEFWSNIVEQAGIPEKFADLYGLLEYEGYVKISNRTNSGDIIAGTNKITAAFYGLERELSSVNISHIDNRTDNSKTGVFVENSTVVDSNLAYHSIVEDKTGEENSEGKQIAKKGLNISKTTLIWTIIGVITAALIGLLPFLK
jgi:hypothetical protein